MRVVVLLSLAALSACASSTPGTARPETESVRIGGAERNNMRMTSITQTNVTPINFPIGKAWHAVPAAFDALSLPITTVDTARHTTFEAMARPIAFSREYSRCSSKGVLEKRLADAVKAQLQ